MKFTYRNHVRLTKGFHEGATGEVRATFGVPYLFRIYLINWDEDYTKSINFESSLEKI